MDAQLIALLRQACRQPEEKSLQALVDELTSLSLDRAVIRDHASRLVRKVREQRRHASGVDHLMHEFSLSSQEGIALMCLAEALLRTPDMATRDRLIRDKIGHGDWHSHLGHSTSLFVNAATWGLLLTGKLVATHSRTALGSALSRLLARGGEPLVRKGVDFAMRLLGQQFVMGENIESALARSRQNETLGYRHSFDMLGEGALTADDAERYAAAYATAIHAIGKASNGRGVYAGPGISIKLSALHPRYTRSQRERVMHELLDRVRELMLLAKKYDIGVNIDAEESERLELSLDLFAALAADPALAGWNGLGFVVQAYQKRAPFVIDALIDLARRHSRRFMLRLVKGAYWDSEIKRTQVDGLPDYPVYTRKVHSDLAYLACASRLLHAPDAIYAQFATHNAHTLASVAAMARQKNVTDYEFQCLHGMGEPLYDHVVGDTDGRPCRIYAPVGTHETLLPYLVRRLLENGANSSFVNRIVDESVSIEQLIEEPLDIVRLTGGQPHPDIPLPMMLYGKQRQNSAGLDLTDEGNIAAIAAALAGSCSTKPVARPLVAGYLPETSNPRPVCNPADRRDIVGYVHDADENAIALALTNASSSAESWHQTATGDRASCLLAAADLMEAERLALIALCVREAGKTWANAVGEIREAVDFCRYYAAQLRDGHYRSPTSAPGVAVCISPWNFPLAIFIGEISAALAAGSTVLAKPAEQTPLIAARAVELLHAAGIPPAVLQFLPGAGDKVGAALVADHRVASVVFTGSTEVARLINKQLASRTGVRLIAETGGQNAMIVDSSALPEQVVQDVMASAFDSAGQRCSALRVLCLQTDIADRVLTMLRAAMRELKAGNPAALSTDVGPVIDADARDRLQAHIDSMHRRGRTIHQLPLPGELDSGTFVPPTLIELDALTDLTDEIFGPVVHVLRFASDKIDRLVDAINASGYGLTLGIHSRIDETIDAIVARARVGNIYVNRNMVGAVVGVQPFGGEGLSGTGPKAGGPIYLHRLGGAAQILPESLQGRLDNTLLDPQSPFRILAEWAFAESRRELAQRCTDYAEASLLPVRLALPGPTGERNRLHFAPRGRLLCMAAAQSTWLHQAAAVLATGNKIAAVDNDFGRKMRSLLPAALLSMISWQAPGSYDGLDGLLLDAEDLSLRQHLAEERGPLIPVFTPGDDSRYPLYRMLVERVVSTNTTAAGGNTTLMTLGS